MTYSQDEINHNATFGPFYSPLFERKTHVSPFSRDKTVISVNLMSASIFRKSFNLTSKESIDLDSVFHLRYSYIDLILQKLR